MSEATSAPNQTNLQIGPQPITEEMGLQAEWYERSKEITLETLPAFLTELTERYHHDYGTICHAVAAAALAAARAVDHSPAGGITGFQAGCVMWEFLRRWLHVSGPLRLVKYEDMLYPQYESKFRALTLSKDAFAYLQKMAEEKLETDALTAHPDVLEHWERIARGWVPFGYTLEEK